MCNKRLLTFITAGFYYFFSGLEYGIIMPTLNLFIRSIHGDKSVIGLCLSAMSLTGLLSAPVFGRVTDYVGKTKAAVIIASIFAVGGNFMYCASTTPYMIVISRLIVGVSIGASSSVISMLTRAVEPKERTTLLSRILSGRQTGVVFGPSLNFFLVYFDFNFLSFKINKYTAPGFLMAVLWIVYLVAAIFCYYDLDSYTIPSASVDLGHEATTGIEIETTCDNSRTSFLRTIYQDLLAKESILIMFSSFVVMFVFNATETTTTPLSLKFFDWGEFENSIYFSSAGSLFVVSLVSLSFTTKIFSDRFLMLFGITALTCNNLLYLLFIIFAIQQPEGSHPPWMFALFITYGVVLGLTNQYAFVPSISLFSKITSKENQGFNQGVLQALRQLARILGPIWGSYLLDDLPIMAGAFFGLFFLCFIMFVFLYKRLPGKEDDDLNLTDPQSAIATDSLENNGEDTPMLPSK